MNRQWQQCDSSLSFVFLKKACGRNVEVEQLNTVLYQVCVFRADPKNNMAALASDWLRHILTFPLKPLNRIQRNLTGSKILHPLPSLCFSGWEVNKNCRPGQSIKEGGTLYSAPRYGALLASCLFHSEVKFFMHSSFSGERQWPFGPLVFWVHGEWMGARDKQIALSGSRAICLFRAVLYSPWTQKKRHSFLIFAMLPSKTLSKIRWEKL